MAALTIDPETARLAQRIADVMAKPVEVVVKEAIVAKAEAAGVTVVKPHRGAAADVLARMLGITDAFATLPVLDDRDADAILGYDLHGVPQ